LIAWIAFFPEKAIFFFQKQPLVFQGDSGKISVTIISILVTERIAYAESFF